MLKAHCKLHFAEYFPDASCNSPGASGVIYRATQPTQEVKRSTTRFNCVPILDGEYNDCALSPQPRAWPDESACNVRLPTSTRRNPTPLTVECEHCEDGTRWTSRYGGNDPDVWRVGPCETCDGTGIREICCALCGEYGATDRVGDEVFHLGCAEEVLADMHRVLEELA